MRRQIETNCEVQCPCCDFFTLSEQGEWEICSVCFWEDDGFRFDDLDFPSGANHGLTLREARLNFRRIGACCSAMLANVLPTDQRSRYRHEPRTIGDRLDDDHGAVREAGASS
ncbi:CPCC family cysteine-rich protein [Burkholderia ubonensis]|uniref:CPCC family cysteine-rich protein n=1 Tax=Burkholderia ubonensis TaxID=101571 RepID=UPI0009B2E6CD|nr:CPCC family cysteine-rich protein [Burkholderia ubonensis]